MRKALVLFHLAGVLFAADPVYFTDPVEGTFFQGLNGRGKFTFVPGKLEDCTSKTSSSASMSSECKLKGAEIKVAFNGQNLSYPVQSMHLNEFNFDKKSPFYSYGFSGAYKETLPNKQVLDTTVDFFFDRSMVHPAVGRGKLDIGGLGVGGAVLLNLK
jgi:hypothetical protein